MNVGDESFRKNTSNKHTERVYHFTRFLKKVEEPVSYDLGYDSMAYFFMSHAVENFQCYLSFDNNRHFLSFALFSLTVFVWLSGHIKYFLTTHIQARISEK